MSGQHHIFSGTGPPTGRWLGPTLVIASCGGIFLVDTLSPLDMAIAVLYALVVLLSARLLERTGLLLVAGSCISLTVLSFTIVHANDFALPSTMRGTVSIVAIMVTTLLCLRNQDATRSLREQAALLDLSHDAIFVRDTSDTVTYWNRGAEALYGWSREEAVGQKASALLKTVFPLARADIAGTLINTGQWEGELAHTTRDGRKLTCISRWSLQHDARGRPMGTMETNHDITERRRAENQLHEMRADLAHVTRASTLAELTTSIAHEVNQPLAAVVTNGEACLRWLRRTVPDIREAELSVTRAIANARRASDVVARLRAVARQGESARAPLGVAELVAESAMLLERDLSCHRVGLDLKLNHQLAPVLGDPVQLQQALINLALNAIQAMDGVPEQERTLRISTFLMAADEAAAPPRVAIQVEDTGPGVAEETLPLLFTPFFSTKKRGIGLGLSISRSIVEAHAGRINAALGAGRGMCFTMALPIAEDVPQAIAKEALP
ncbi:two-component system sensor histidine kinase NtrB [Xanthobacter variabilis]|uniref:two-component system sensor histidine kinase NtrB n=1 Tax=Xanthobacter variabilis TaxID=3119932 RepID=UPI00372A3E12